MPRTNQSYFDRRASVRQTVDVTSSSWTFPPAAELPGELNWPQNLSAA